MMKTFIMAQQAHHSSPVTAPGTRRRPVSRDYVNRLRALYECLDPPIAYYRHFRLLTGSVKSALLLSQMVYWTMYGRDVALHQGWFYKDRQCWLRETGLSRHELDTARKILRQTKLVNEQHRGMPRRTWYQIELAVLGRKLAALARQELNGELTLHDVRSNPLWLHTLCGPIQLFHREFARICHSTPAALLLDCLLTQFFTTVRPHDHHIQALVLHQQQWRFITGMERRQLDNARATLYKLGLVFEKLVGTPPVIALTINVDQLEQRLEADAVLHPADQSLVSEQELVRQLHPQYAGHGVTSIASAPQKFPFDDKSTFNNQSLHHQNLSVIQQMGCFVELRKQYCGISAVNLPDLNHPKGKTMTENVHINWPLTYKLVDGNVHTRWPHPTKLVGRIRSQQTDGNIQNIYKGLLQVYKSKTTTTTKTFIAARHVSSVDDQPPHSSCHLEIKLQHHKTAGHGVASRLTGQPTLAISTNKLLQNTNQDGHAVTSKKNEFDHHAASQLILPAMPFNQQMAVLRMAMRWEADNLLRQQLLDELAGAMQFKPKGISNPVGYCHRMLNAAKQGDFTPNYGLRIEAMRLTEQATQQAFQQKEKMHAAHLAGQVHEGALPPTIDPEKSRAEFIAAKEALKKQSRLQQAGHGVASSIDITS